MSFWSFSSPEHNLEFFAFSGKKGNEQLDFECCLFRFYDEADGRNHRERQDNAVNNIRFYFAHVANGVRV